MRSSSRNGSMRRDMVVTTIASMQGIAGSVIRDSIVHSKSRRVVVFLELQRLIVHDGFAATIAGNLYGATALCWTPLRRNIVLILLFYVFTEIHGNESHCIYKRIGGNNEKRVGFEK